ncbi:putative transcriptional regulatory protein PB1A11.04c [Rhodotorula toruloides]|nr:putative transcriptional regulatory protein PB1A11.04c [Rhodotorula toruloides]
MAQAGDPIASGTPALSDQGGGGGGPDVGAEASGSGSGAQSNGGVGEKQKKKVKVGARASIACKTCRKRKVRCSAEWPICRFCTNRKLECVYEGHPAENGGPMVAGPSGFAPLAPMYSPALDTELPPTNIILEALDSFLIHHYDTFPFIHRPSLTTEISENRASKELVCCILALAARFFQSLRDLHPSSPSAASEHYAQLASHLLSVHQPLPGHANPPPPTADVPISLMRCQCHLLLGFYELTAGRDNSGWLKIGTAIRMAQTLRLGFDDEVPVYDDPENPLSSRGRAIAAAQQDPIRAETRRRTFWALFSLDRTVSDGNERPCGLKVPRIASLRMPGSDADFLAGRKSLGARFDPNPPPWSVSVQGGAGGGANGASADGSSGHAPTSDEPEADLYGFTLRIAEIWSKVASYIGSGGRNVDRRPPWQDDSTFAQLAKELTEFEQRLPEELKYSQRTLVAHCMVREDAKLFALLHLTNAMARHVLHRDYLPFLPPLDFKAANGPIDGEPLYGDSTAPAGWWQESFDMAATSANTISDVCSHLSSHGIILTHPFAGFAAVAAGTVHSHLKYWPQSSSAPVDATHYLNQDAEILAGLRNIYPIATRWYDSLAGLQLLYFNLARGVLDADPLKVRAGVLQLLRSAKDDADNDSPNRGAAAANSANGNGAAQLSAANGNGQASKPKGQSRKSRKQEDAAAPSSERSRSFSQTINDLVNSPLGSAGAEGDPVATSAALDPSAAAAYSLFHPPFPMPHPPTSTHDLSFATLAPELVPGDFSFDLAASSLGGLGLSTLDEWGAGYYYGGSNWGLAGFGGLSGAGFPAGPALFGGVGAGAAGGQPGAGGTDGMAWTGL